ncbi:MAG: hypothetical protein QM765_26095 [Myxococcales bacterium]
MLTQDAWLVQSWGQFALVSPASQVPSPSQGQSAAQLALVSPVPQTPSWLQTGQSLGQFAVDSQASHLPSSLQAGLGQSAGQLTQFSPAPASQVPLPLQGLTPGCSGTTARRAERAGMLTEKDEADAGVSAETRP